jgi:hypothetical protein
MKKKPIYFNTQDDWHSADNFSPKRELNCANCGYIFSISKPYQMFCSEECEKPIEKKMEDHRTKTLDILCECCGLMFRRAQESMRSKCCDTCKHQKMIIDVQKKSKKQRLESFVKDKKPRGNRISLDEMIRRQEYKRVMDDEGWDHFLKGRRWDKI